MGSAAVHSAQGPHRRLSPDRLPRRHWNCMYRNGQSSTASQAPSPGWSSISTRATGFRFTMPTARFRRCDTNSTTQNNSHGCALVCKSSAHTSGEPARPRFMCLGDRAGTARISCKGRYGSTHEAGGATRSLVKPRSTFLCSSTTCDGEPINLIHAPSMVLRFETL